MPDHPRVFVSYSHDSDEHKAVVLQMSNQLRTSGIDVNLDQYEPHPPEGWPRWMTQQIDESDFVIVVCSERYCERAEGRNPPPTGKGANYEGAIINQRIFDANGLNEKFLPLIFDQASEAVPSFLRPYSFYRWPSGKEDLLRRLTAQPAIVKPTLGAIPVLPARPMTAPSGSPPGPRVRAAGSDEPPGRDSASALMQLCSPAVGRPWRQVSISPYTVPSRLFSGASFRKHVQAASLPIHVSDELQLPSPLREEPKRPREGYWWRRNADPIPIDDALAVCFDGSTGFRAALWEAKSDPKSLVWGGDGVAVGSCIDQLIGMIALSDRLLAPLGPRRPVAVSFSLEGISGRHFVYDGQGNRGAVRAEEDDVVSTAPLRVNATRSQIAELVVALLSDLDHQLGPVDMRYVRERAKQRLKLALPVFSYRYPEETEIAADGGFRAISGGCTHADNLHPVRFEKDGAVVESSALVDLEDAHWPVSPKGVPREFMARVRSVLRGEE